MKKLLSPWWALVTIILLISVFVSKPVFLESIKLNYFDQLIVNAEPTQKKIYTATIDEAALTKYGQYPFPRNVYADSNYMIEVLDL